MRENKSTFHSHYLLTPRDLPLENAKANTARLGRACLRFAGSPLGAAG